MLTPLQDLRARLRPGALLFALATPVEARALRVSLPDENRAWVGWARRDALLGSWRPAAQERYSSMAGRDAPTLAQWLRPAFSDWRRTADGVAALTLDADRLDAALGQCQLTSFADRAVSLLSNGESWPTPWGGVQRSWSWTT